MATLIPGSGCTSSPDTNAERMFQRRILRAFACLPFLLGGCQLFPAAPESPLALFGPRLANRKAIARCLPSGIRLDTPLCWYRPEMETVEDALVKVGARLGPDGKLYSAAGKEIYFEHRAHGGPPQLPLSAEQSEAASRARRELEARYTIITITYLHC